MWFEKDILLYVSRLTDTDNAYVSKRFLDFCLQLFHYLIHIIFCFYSIKGFLKTYRTKFINLVAQNKNIELDK